MKAITSRICMVCVAVAIVVFYLFIYGGRALSQNFNPAIPACEQAIAAGYYTVELYGQCLDDYADSRKGN